MHCRPGVGDIPSVGDIRLWPELPITEPTRRGRPRPPSRYPHRGVYVPYLSYVTASMRVMPAGNGYKYLLKSVAAGDGDRSLSTPLTRYYTEAGTP